MRALLPALVLLAVACGRTEDPARLAAYCATTLRLESVGEPDAGQPLDEFVGSEVLPLMTDLAATAPPEVADDVRSLRDLAEAVASTGDPAVFTSPAFQQRNARVHAFELAHCGWSRTDVVTAAGGFAGIPDALGAGPRSFELTNAGTTPHQLAILRKEPNAPPTLVTSAFAGVGENAYGYAVADLAPGEYVAVCSLSEGMVRHFTVR